MTTKMRAVHGWLAVILIGGLIGTLAALAEDAKTLPATTSAPAPKSGKVVGIFLSHSGDEIKVKPEGTNEPQTFVLTAAGGTPDSKIAKAVKAAGPPNVVAFDWKLEGDQRVITSFRELQRPERNGVVTGTVMGKSGEGDKTPYLEVKAAGLTYTEEYWLNWVNGQWDKSIVGAIADLNIGDKVKITWNRDERLRVSQIQVIAKAPATAPAQPKK